MFGRNRNNKGAQQAEEAQGYDIRNERVKATLLKDEIDAQGKKVRREVVVASYGPTGVPRLVVFHKWTGEDGAEKFRVFSGKPQLCDGIIAAGAASFEKLKEAIDAHNAAVKAAGGVNGAPSAKAVAAAEASAKAAQATAKAAAATALLEKLTKGEMSVADYTAALQTLNATFPSA